MRLMSCLKTGFAAYMPLAILLRNLGQSHILGIQEFVENEMSNAVSFEGQARRAR
jgi:hypothetical protein